MTGTRSSWSATNARAVPERGRRPRSPGWTRRRSRTSTASTPRSYPDLAALVGEQSDNLPGVPGVGPKTAAKWLNQFGSLERTWSTGSTRSRARPASTLREHLADVDPEPADQRAGPRPDPGRHGHDLVRTPWDRVQGAHAVRQPGVPGRCASGLVAEHEEVDATVDHGFEVDGCGSSSRARWPPGSRSTSAPASGVGVRSAGQLGLARHRRDHGLALANTSGAAAWFDPIALTPDDDAACRPGSPTQAAEGAARRARARCRPARARLDRWPGWSSDTQLSAYLARPDQRSYDLAADLTVRYLSASCATRRPRTVSSASTYIEGGPAADHTMLRARAIADLADTLDAELDEAGRYGAARGRRVAADRRDRRDGAATGSRSTGRIWRSSRSGSPPESGRPRRRRTR